MTARRRTVLIVEDEPGLRTVIAEFLEEHGFEVLFAGNGVEALEVVSSGVRVGLIVLDLVMPVMDGASFLLELRLRHKGSLPTVLIATATPEDSIPVDRSAYVACLTKPFHPIQLFQAIDYCTSPEVARG